MAYRETDLVRSRKQARRERLLLAVWSLVAERGFASVRVSDVAKRAGMATGTVYRYFPSREALFVAVFERATEVEVEQVRQALAGNERPVARRVEQALKTFARRALRAPVMAWSLIAEPVAPQVEQARLDYRGSYARLFRAAIEEGMHHGEFPRQRADLAANAVVGALAEALAGPLAPRRDSQIGPEDSETMIDNLVGFCLGGLTGPARSKP